MNQNKNSSSLILVHHGILGQKWGVRRYQNPDGTLTAEGRERYDVEERSEPQESRDNRTFFQRHKKAIIAAGVIVSAIAIKKGINYFNNRQDDRIDEIVKAYEKSWNKNAVDNMFRTWNNGGSWLNAKAQHKAAVAERINQLYTMPYPALAAEAKRVNRVFRHSEEG